MCDSFSILKSKLVPLALNSNLHFETHQGTQHLGPGVHMTTLFQKKNLHCIYILKKNKKDHFCSCIDVEGKKKGWIPIRNTTDPGKSTPSETLNNLAVVNWCWRRPQSGSEERRLAPGISALDEAYALGSTSWDISH